MSTDPRIAAVATALLNAAFPNGHPGKHDERLSADYQAWLENCHADATIAVAALDAYRPAPTASSGPGADGWCGFCGGGHGHLTDQGDETSEYLHSATRAGEPGNWTYHTHPGALTHDTWRILWCGHCPDGLAHKWQRYDDTNLHALHKALTIQLRLDPPRWERPDGTPPDDIAVHARKLRAETDLAQIRREQARRAAQLTET